MPVLSGIPQFTTFGTVTGGLVFDLTQFNGLIKLLRGFSTIGDDVMLALESLFVTGYDMSQEVVHVITGELKGSGFVKRSGETLEFRYTAGHAGYEEYGNRFREGHPYFRPSVQYINDNIPMTLEEAMVKFIEKNRA